ncbi:hypothetical protein AGOR_G00150780 [Albula goreensis]|uniref:Uncharacterized protein n=1 Tax=Albula goreensis TaxID=1534307 RepID=A0A8T3D3B7_9TELE|nr:hypothetical protein AGOR_G00150780 [Albula goreensis]
MPVKTGADMQRITTPLAPSSAAKGQLVKETSRKVSVGPFTSPEDLAWKTAEMKDSEDTEEGFMIVTLKKRQSLRSAKHRSHQRLKWSRELEMVPTLNALNKRNSQAQVGSALGYTSTSHWLTSSAENAPHLPVSAFTDEGSCHFSLSGSVGKLVGQQLQRGNVVRVGTNGHCKSSGESPERDTPVQAQSPAVQEGLSDPVPLSIIDELERKNVKILTPRSPSVYMPLPIVSETYPVVFHSDYQHKPFSGPGFHSAGSGQAHCQTQAPGGARKSHKLYSAIIRITQSVQEERLVRGVKERMWEERYSHPEVHPESAPNVKRLGLHKVKLREYSSYTSIIKSADMKKFPKQCHNPSVLTTRTAPVIKRPPVPVTAPWQKSTSAIGWGRVLNGVNPKHCSDTTTCPPACFGGLPGPARGKTNRYQHQTPSHTISHKKPKPGWENKTDFLFISKPLNHKDINPFVCKQNSTKEEDCSGQALLPVIQAADKNNAGEDGLSSALPKPAQSPLPSCDAEIHSETSDIPVPVKECTSVSEAEGSGRDSEGVIKPGVPLHRHHAVSIPTAECL